jgi:limonene-1,2-epoxide hydrolase
MGIGKASKEQRVRGFFASWERDFEHFCASFPELMSEDCLLVQSGIPDVRGPQQATSLLRAGREHHGIDTIRVELLHLIAMEQLIVTERIGKLMHGLPGARLVG